MHAPTYSPRARGGLKSARDRESLGRILQAIYLATGGLVAIPLALVTFILVYIAAIDSVGWVIGLVLGWIPAFWAAAIVFFLGAYLWPLVVLIALEIARHWN